MFIDIHAHCYRKPFFQLPGREPWPTAETLLPIYDRLGVEKGCIMPLIGPEFYLPGNNEDILDIAAAHPDRFIPFCNIHPQAICNDPQAPLEQVLRQYKDAGCKGVGEVICNRSFFDPYMRNLFRAIQEVDLPMTIHVGHRQGGCYGIIDEPGLPGLDETLQDFPKLKIFAHSMPIWAEIAPLKAPFDRAGYPKGKIEKEGALFTLMRKHENLYGDLSAGSGANAFMRDPEFSSKFLMEFQDRLLFGIDICSAAQHPSHSWLIDCLNKMVADGLITQECFDKIARKNAIRILGL